MTWTHRVEGVPVDEPVQCLLHQPRRRLLLFLLLLLLRLRLGLFAAWHHGIILAPSGARSIHRQASIFRLRRRTDCGPLLELTTQPLGQLLRDGCPHKQRRRRRRLVIVIDIAVHIIVVIVQDGTLLGEVDGSTAGGPLGTALVQRRGRHVVVPGRRT